MTRPRIWDLITQSVFAGYWFSRIINEGPNTWRWLGLGVAVALVVTHPLSRAAWRNQVEAPR